MFWLSAFFIADIMLNKAEHLESLCLTLVTSIIATMIPYFIKSYFETKEEKKMEYFEKLNNEEKLESEEIENE